MICKHNQTGFCKYRQQCTKEHFNEICKDNIKCTDPTCFKRHPKKCKNFDVFGKCKFTNCDYVHSDDEVNHKVKLLEKCVIELKTEVVQLIKVEDDNRNQKITDLEKEIEVLKDTVKNTANDLKTTQLLIKQMNDKNYTEQLVNERADSNSTIEASKLETKEKRLKCKVCDYKCKKQVTLRKHTNTKHSKIKYNCDKCLKTFTRNVELEDHMQREHCKDLETKMNNEQDIEPVVSEC